MITAVVLSKFMTIVGAALIAVLAVLRFASRSRPVKSDSDQLSKTGALHV